MANIVLCRIDSRLIHGQVVTKWVGQSQANRIAVVSDELDADPFMKNIYLMAAPPNIKVDCFGNQSFAAAWKENQLGDGNVLVLFPRWRRCRTPYNWALTSPAFRLAVSAAGQTARRFFRILRWMKKTSAFLTT